MDSLDSLQNTSLTQSIDVTAYSGIDWADRKHDICLNDLGTNTQNSASSNTLQKPLPHGLKAYESDTMVTVSSFTQSKSVALCSMPYVNTIFSHLPSQS